MAAAAQEANAIIDLRAFSWSDLFAQLEATLPENVRLTSFQPQEDRTDSLIVNLRVAGAARAGPRDRSSTRSKRPARFHEVLAAEEQTDPEGLDQRASSRRCTCQRRRADCAEAAAAAPTTREEPPVSDATQSVISSASSPSTGASVYVLVAGVVINVVGVRVPRVSAAAAMSPTSNSGHGPPKQSLAAAQADFARANGTLTGKDRALKELDTFYSRVLAQDLTGARRLTFARLARWPPKSGLDFERRKYEPVDRAGQQPDAARESSMELAGSYADIRDFIHEIESSPEFVVIDNVARGRGYQNDDSLRPEPAAVDLLPDDRSRDDDRLAVSSLLLGRARHRRDGDRCLAAAVDDRG